MIAETIVSQVVRDVDVEICWMAGQSNSLGRKVLPTTSDPTVPRADIRYWHHDLAYVQPEDDRDLDNVATADWQGGEVEIGVRMVDTSSRYPYAVAKTARGSTGLVDPSHWAPSSTTGELSKALSSLRAFIDRLVHEQPTRLPVVGSVVWNQWEEDGKTTADSDAYQANLTALIARFRAEVHPKLPVVITMASTAATSRSSANIDKIRSAQSAVAAADSLVSTVETSDLALEADNTHYTADAQQTLGARCAAALAAFARPDYDDTSLVARVSLYGSYESARDVSRFLRRIGAGGQVLRAPYDPGIWAVTDPLFGYHHVPVGAWA